MMNRNLEIIDFINRRFKTDCHWMDGNCYYFATILITRFRELHLVYLPILGHFMAYSQMTQKYYDFQGAHRADQILADDHPMFFSEIKQTDPLYYDHIVRDCIK